MRRKFIDQIIICFVFTVHLDAVLAVVLSYIASLLTGVTN